jgi:hypothetical protein
VITHPPFALSLSMGSLLVALLSAAPVHTAGAAADSDDTAQAQAGALAMDLMSGRMVAYCEAQAPARAAAVHAAWQRWRGTFSLDAIARQAGPSVAAQAQQAFAPQSDGIARRLAARGPADGVCAQLAESWSAPAMDLRRQFPLAYRGVQAPAAAPAHQPSRPAAAGAPARQGTLYTPAQLSALAEQWPKGERDRERGPFYVKGTLRSKGEHVFLEQSDGAFKARLFVHPDIDLRARVGQEVVLEGYLDRAPRNPPVQWKRTRVVDDPSALQPSPLPQAGLVRTEVALDQVRAAAGRGIPAGELSAVLLESRRSSGGTARVHKPYYLLRDGSAYLRGELPPADLDVARSRELEPQQWARWRRAGRGWEIQRQDDHGQPGGAWQALEATAMPPWAPDSRPGGVYAKSSFHGSIAAGGVHTRATITLGEDGRFSTSRLAQGGSGTMAATDGFAGSASSHRGPQGSRSSAGGGGAGAFAGSSATRDDGADHRGRYRLDGYTAELHYDSGRIERGLSFPWGDDRRMVYWFNGLYLRDGGGQ